MNYNGWLGFAVATLLFFAAPPLYRLIDPTAGQFDAGYIHPIIYSAVLVCFSSGLAFLLLKLTAPGLHKTFDEFLEHDGTEPMPGFQFSSAKFAFILYLTFMVLICVTVWCMV